MNNQEIGQSCLLTVLKNNENLKQYFGKCAEMKDISNINIFSENNEKALRKLHKWNLFLRTCKSLIIVALIGVIAMGVGLHLLPNLAIQLNNLNFSDFSNIVDKGNEIKNEIKEIGETVVSDVAMATLASKVEYSGTTHQDNNELTLGVKLTLTNIIKKLAEYDLLFEMYRTNLIIIKKLIEGLESNGKMDADTKHIIKNLYYITINDYKKVIEGLYKCFFLTVKMDNSKMAELLEGNNPKENQFNVDISSDNFDKVFFKKIYSYMTRVNDRNKNTSYSILYSLITQFEDFEESLAPLLVRLNSYITRLNLLFNLSKCPEGLDLKVNNIKPIFGSLMNQLIHSISGEQQSSTVIAKVTDELSRENSGIVMSEQDIRLSLSQIHGELCDIKGAEAKGIKDLNIGNYSICKKKIDNNGVSVFVQNWEIGDIYNTILNDNFIVNRLEEFIKTTKYDFCESATGKGKQMCLGDKKIYFQALMMYIKDNLAELNNKKIGSITYDSLKQPQSGGNRHKKKSKRQKRKSTYRKKSDKKRKTKNKTLKKKKTKNLKK